MINKYIQKPTTLHSYQWDGGEIDQEFYGLIKKHYPSYSVTSYSNGEKVLKLAHVDGRDLEVDVGSVVCMEHAGSKKYVYVVESVDEHVWETVSPKVVGESYDLYTLPAFRNAIQQSDKIRDTDYGIYLDESGCQVVVHEVLRNDTFYLGKVTLDTFLALEKIGQPKSVTSILWFTKLVE